MSKSKLFAWILSILGFQMQSCFPFSAIEYGCQHTEFKTNGTVKDENGKKMPNTEVNVKFDVYDTNGRMVRQETASSEQMRIKLDSHGVYIVKAGVKTLKLNL